MWVSLGFSYCIAPRHLLPRRPPRGNLFVSESFPRLVCLKAHWYGGYIGLGMFMYPACKGFDLHFTAGGAHTGAQPGGCIG